MHTKSLKEIADVFHGYGFRTAIDDSVFGKLGVVQASNVDSSQLYLDPDTLKRIDSAPDRARYYLQEGDVVITSRAALAGDFKACVFAGSEYQVIASSSVFIIRLKSDIQGEYLAMYLNSPAGQVALNRGVSGAYIKTLLRSQLSAIQIPIPAETKQETVIELYKNISNQNKLLDQKKQTNKNILQGVLTTTINAK